MGILTAIGLISIVFVMLSATVMLRRDKKKARELQLPEGPTLAASSAASDSVPPSSDGEKNATRVPSPTSREQMEAEIAGQRRMGSCVVCGDPATRPTPRFVHKQSPLDWFYRKFNALAPQKRVIEEEFDIIVKPDLCGECQPLARGHLNAFMTDKLLEGANFIERQNQSYREFQRYGLYERMREDANAIKRGKKKRQGNVVQLVQTQKAANGNG